MTEERNPLNEWVDHLKEEYKELRRVVTDLREYVAELRRTSESVDHKMGDLKHRTKDQEARIRALESAANVSPYEIKTAVSNRVEEKAEPLRDVIHEKLEEVSKGLDSRLKWFLVIFGGAQTLQIAAIGWLLYLVFNAGIIG